MADQKARKEGVLVGEVGVVGREHASVMREVMRSKIGFASFG